MTPRMKRHVWILLSASLAGCGSGSGTSGNVVKPDVTKPDVTNPDGPPDVTPPAPTAAETFAKTCADELGRAKAQLPTILGISSARTVANTLEPFNELLRYAGNAGAMAGLNSEVHPDEAVRDAARACEQEISKFRSELSLDRNLFAAIAAVDVSKEDPDTQRFVAHTLRDYRRAGVDKDDATRARLKAIDEELTKLGQAFSKVLAEDVGKVALDPADLAGLPADYVAAHPPGADGKVTITTDYPDLIPFMTYADSDAARKQLYVVNRTRGAATNPATLQQILTLRAEQAGLLGYANWADYVTEDKMMKSGQAAADFIAKVHKLAAPRAKRDYAELLKELKKTDKKATAVADWQKARLEDRVKKEKYQVNAEEVRAYLPYDKVLAGLLDITSAVYDIQYAPVADAQPWHADVRVFDVNRGATKLGRIYLDMHPREGKYKHAAQFTVRDGVTGVQLPEGALICNFPQPSAGNPALMEHDDVTTMFHEFGHLMHHVLGGNHRWIRQSGVATEWDFVEAPSQMFEEWAWNYDTLKRFAVNAAGEVIPEKLVTAMRRADEFGQGTAAVQQMYYAAMSLEFHRADPAKLDQVAEVRRLQTTYTPFAYVEGTQMQASFGHLVGYSAIYYTYMWSQVMAKDLLTPFAKKGLMDTATTYAYRDKVLVPGGTKDAADLMKDFLGRPYSFKAFEDFLTK
jgi:thimet oligopeptidase